MNQDDAKVNLARRVEKLWLEKVAAGDIEAEGLGPVVDALYYGEPDEAVIRCHEGRVSEAVERQIRQVYGL